MADRVSVQCPGCLAKLNLSDSSKLGKKIKCPKCSDIFVASAGDDEDLDDLEDDDAAAKPKAGGKRPATAGKKGGAKKGKSGGGGSSNGPLIGAGVAVVALIGAGLFFSGFFSGPKPLPAPPVEPAPVQAPVVAAAAPPPAPVIPPISAAEKILGLRWMPADTEMLFHVKVSELWQAPLLKEAVNHPLLAAGIAEFQTKTGLLPTDLESATFGIAELPKTPGMTSMGMFPAMSMGMPGQMKPPKLVMVIRSKKPVTFDEIVKADPTITTAEYNSKKYFQFPSDGQTVGGWFPDATTLIVAPVPELKGIIDRGETVIPRKELLVMDAKPHLIVVVAPKDPKSLSKDLPPSTPGTPPEFEAMQTTIKESMTAVGLGISIRGGFDLQTSMMLSDPAGVAKVKPGLELGIVEGKKQFEQLKAMGIPLLADLGEMLLNNLKVDTQGQIVTLSTNIPDSEQQRIETLAQFGMAMASGGSPFGAPGGLPMSPGGASSFGPAGTPAGALGSQMLLQGQTAPVAADAAEGIPDGSELTASTAWTPVPSADGKMNSLLVVLLDLKGSGIESVCGFGQATIKTITAGGGGAIRGTKSEIPGQPNLTKVLASFDPAEPDPGQPAGTMRLALRFDAPKEKETEIGVLEGTFKYLTSADSAEFTLDEVPKTAKRPLMDPALKAAGVKMLINKSAVPNTLTLSCGKGFFLGPVHAIFADGVVLPFTAEFEKNIVLQRMSNPSFPDDLQIKFKVFREVKEHTVTFKFANVPLPPAAAKQMPLGQPPGGFGPGGPQAPQAFPQPAAGPQSGPQAPGGGPRVP